MRENKEIITVNNDSIVTKNKNIKQPGDKMTQEMMPSGDIVTRLATKEKKATARQYMKKDGTPGKMTITFMQPDE